jgi:DNA-binding MarR family transcriptional regulator
VEEAPTALAPDHWAAGIEAAERLHWQLFRLTAAYRRRDQENGAVGGLTLTQSSMLFTLRERGPMRLGELAAFQKVSSPTTTQAVGRLESLGLVRRVRDRVDHRVVSVEITPEGDALQRSALQDLLQLIVAELDAGEVDALRAALMPLERISRAFEDPRRSGDR